jgi:glutathione S-transferase
MDIRIDTNSFVFLHQQYGVNRYQTETRRLYSVLDKHLASEGRQYLCGTKCTIAGEWRTPHCPNA